MGVTALVMAIPHSKGQLICALVVVALGSHKAQRHHCNSRQCDSTQQWTRSATAGVIVSAQRSIFVVQLALFCVNPLSGHFAAMLRSTDLSDVDLALLAEFEFAAFDHGVFLWLNLVGQCQ
jgi:hypothetical protein